VSKLPGVRNVRKIERIVMKLDHMRNFNPRRAHDDDDDDDRGNIEISVLLTERISSQSKHCG